jgi:2-polyprenyl-3-methyl-5-hydroxy-6-metoxy-1,4-benzoquinol methylase
MDDFKGYERTSLYACGKCDLRFFSPVKAGSERFYGALQRTARIGLSKATYYVDDKPEYALALKLISPGAKVLEIGAGKGAFGSRIRSADYVGLELSEDAVKMAASAGVQVRNELVQQHALSHKGEYDVVCAFQVLEHIVDVASFIQACVECLRPGGTLIYAVPSDDTFIALGRNSMLNMPPHHVTRWTDAALANLAAAYRLEVIFVQHEKLGEMHRKMYAITVVYHLLLRTFRKNTP